MIPLFADIVPSTDWYDGASFGLLLIRVVVGVTMAAHGYNKFFGGGRIPGTASWFDSMGMKPNGRIHAIMAASTELGAGLLFAVGFLTPLAAAGFVGLMVVAAYTVHLKNGFFIVKSGWEYNSSSPSSPSASPWRGRASTASTGPSASTSSTSRGSPPSAASASPPGRTAGHCYRPPAEGADGGSDRPTRLTRRERTTSMRTSAELGGRRRCPVAVAGHAPAPPRVHRADAQDRSTGI